MLRSVNATEHRPIIGSDDSSSTSAAQTSFTIATSPRRRGFGNITQNACTECRKKRAKVRQSKMAETLVLKAMLVVMILRTDF